MRLLGWLFPAVLAVGAVAGATVAWRAEAAAPSALTAVEERSLVTPVLSVRRAPTVLAGPIAERRLRTDLAALVRLLPPSSCLVVDGPELRVEHRADEPVVPASTQKLLTAVAALDHLDQEARFRTAAVAASPPGTDGVVVGDLALVGGGDPLLATADYMSRFRRQPQLFTDLDTLAAAIASSGVRRIAGSVVGDERRYDTERYRPRWPARYVEQDSIGPASALSVNDGFARYPTEHERSTPLEPAGDPAAEAAAVLTRLLEARGIDVGGPPRAGALPSPTVEVAAVESAPLAEVVGQLLRESDNETGELLLKELGRTAGRPTAAGGARVVGEVVDDPAATVYDGSGLALENRVTCTLLVDLLRRPSSAEVIDAYLPVAGESGTLKERFDGTPLEAVLRAKTGSLTSVSALAGFVEDEDPPLAFALVVNTAPGTRVPEEVAGLQQRIAEVMAAWPRVPDLDALGPAAAAAGG
jgi:D-alanyl-D-alanine carboxypeptidase/D-alanyl-D-alanine-endopeptidase (penicillin-binding protein 4)